MSSASMLTIDPATVPALTAAGFRMANAVAIAGWIALATMVIIRRPARGLKIAAVVATAMALVYSILMATHAAATGGGFDSLPAVSRLMSDPWVLLAGWMHYLAFDLLVGAWIANDLDRLRRSRLWLVMLLPATFVAGPAGWLAWMLLRSIPPRIVIRSATPAMPVTFATSATPGTPGTTTPLTGLPSLSRIVRAAWTGEPWLAGIAALCLLMIPPSLLASFIDTRTVAGVGTWVKPIKFQLSIAVHLLTVCWALHLLPASARTSRTVRACVRTLAVAQVFEVTYITWQGVLAMPSHFNLTTPMHATLFALMGAMASAISVATVMIGWQSWRHRRQTPGPEDGDRSVLAHATAIGFIAGGTGALVTGIMLSMNGGHDVGAHEAVSTTAASMSTWVALLTPWSWLGWNRAGGDLRVAHFVALHLMQVLPVVAWLGLRRLQPGQVRRLTWLVLAVGLVATALTLAQALGGRPFMPG